MPRGDPVTDAPIRVRRPKGLPFVQVSTEIVRDTTLTPQARFVYVLIASFADVNDRDAMLYRKTLADLLGKSVDTVDRAVQELVDAGYLEVQYQYGKGGKQGANTYDLYEPHTGRGRTHAAPPGTTGAAPMRRGGPHPCGPLEQETLEQEVSNDTSSADADALPLDVPRPKLVQASVGPRGTGAVVGFDQFWEAYPKKADKGSARKAWDKAIKKVPTPSVIIRAALIYRNDPNREPQYTKNPATWLNAEAWGNDPLPERAGRASDVGRSPWESEAIRD
jgi:hypothetical protein